MSGKVSGSGNSLLHYHLQTLLPFTRWFYVSELRLLFIVAVVYLPQKSPFSLLFIFTGERELLLSLLLLYQFISPLCYPLVHRYPFKSQNYFWWFCFSLLVTCD